MVIDTSALVAILKAELDAEALLMRINRADTRLISSATRLEIGIVVFGQLAEAGLHELELLLAHAEIQTIPFTVSHLHWALHGWRQFGKGRLQAGLNLGDCFSYGLARALDLPLLFKGKDFVLTDVESALV